MAPPTTKPGMGPEGDGVAVQPAPEVSAPPSAEPLIRAVPMPDAETPGDEDPRPRWERANMPKNEWDRALRSSDAAVARVEPGSPEFSRLMEVRVRLHFPPPAGVSLGDIDRYKQAQFEKVAGADLSRERARMDPKAPAWHRAVIIGVSACSVALVVYFVWAIVTGGAGPQTNVPRTSTTGTAAPAATNVGVEIAPAKTEATAATPPTATEAPTARAPATTARPALTVVPVPTETAKTAAPTPTATAKPAASGVKPYFD